MPTDLEQLRTIKSLALAQLVELRGNPKPSYTLDGQSVPWESYALSLQKTIDWCDAKLADGEPYEEASQGTT